MLGSEEHVSRGSGGCGPGRWRHYMPQHTATGRCPPRACALPAMCITTEGCLDECWAPSSVPQCTLPAVCAWQQPRPELVGWAEPIALYVRIDVGIYMHTFLLYHPGHSSSCHTLSLYTKNTAAMLIIIMRGKE